MTGKRTRIVWTVAAVLVVAGVPLGGKWARQDTDARCAEDGVRIDPVYRVRVVDADGEHDFCCPRCAGRWMARDEDGPFTVYVTDEVGGDDIDARTAWFVYSPVVTDPVTGNRVRAFRDRADAEAHVRAFGGRLMERSEDPCGDDSRKGE